MIACTAKWSSIIFSSGSAPAKAPPPMNGANCDSGTWFLCTGASDGGAQ